jgi:predicted phosphate transport protein (TIGR00153 family)
LRLGGFLRKRAEDEIYQSMNEHLSRVNLATQALMRAVQAWKENDFKTLDREIDNVSAEENAADKILADMWLELTKGNLKPKLRADILTFIKRADEVAGYAKRAGKNMLILHQVKLPEHIFEEIEKMVELVGMCAKKLIDALTSFRNDLQRTVDITTEISFLEHQVDGLYSRVKNHYFEYENFSDNFAGLILFDHAMRDLEEAANSAEDAADVLKSIVISEI